jgi:hypothetical protein
MEPIQWQCERCEKVVPEDETEECSCGRKVCWECSSYDREWDTGAEIFSRCLTCEESLGDAERLDEEYEQVRNTEAGIS